MGENMAQQQADLSSLKTNAEVFFRSYGMSVSDGSNALLKDAMEHGKLSFVIDQNTDDGYSAEWEAEDPYYTKERQVELIRRAREMDAGINCSEHELIEVD
jgi:hypothetical protein